MPLRDESDFDFFSRRAMEESRAAARAGSRRVGAAHRRMAVAYAVRMREEQLAAEGLAEMLALIADPDTDNDNPEGSATG